MFLTVDNGTNERESRLSLCVSTLISILSIYLSLISSLCILHQNIRLNTDLDFVVFSHYQYHSPFMQFLASSLLLIVFVEQPLTVKKKFFFAFSVTVFKKYSYL